LLPKASGGRSERGTNLKEQQDMKSRIFLFGMAALCSAPAMAGVIIHDAMRFPPGPTIWAMFVQLFGG
jgi:hypothetical protein